MALNPNEAPEGFVAQSANSCIGCDFFVYAKCLKSALCEIDFSCISMGRNDKQNVIFISKTFKPATANFPHDDMGTY